MSGHSDGESVWRPILRFFAVLGYCYGILLVLTLLALWWKDALNAHAASLAFYLVGGLIGAGYVLVMLGANSTLGIPGLTPPTYAYFPLDTDLVNVHRRASDMQQIAALVFALLALFWGGGVLLEMYA